MNREVVSRTDRAKRSPQLSDLRLEQAPALAPELLSPGGVDARQLGSECGLIDLVERNAARHEALAPAGARLALVVALLTYIFDGIPVDHGLDVVGQALPGGKMRHQVKSGPHVVGQAHIF